MSARALGVLAGGDMAENMLIKWAKAAEILVAADDGAKVLIENGFQPTVIGDLDSLSESLRHAHLEIVHDPDQSTTDCDKLLSHALKSGLDSITLIGIEGDLLDHVLASIYSAARSPLAVRIALRRGLGWIVRPGDAIAAPTVPGRRVSLLPITTAAGVDVSGVEWPLANDVLEPHGKVSISNIANADHISVAIEDGRAFLFVEYPESELPQW